MFDATIELEKKNYCAQINGTSLGLLNIIDRSNKQHYKMIQWIKLAYHSIIKNSSAKHRQPD